MKESVETGAKEYSGPWWASKIDSCGKSLNEKWRDSAEKIQKRYLDERDGEDNVKKYNIFWSNVQILKSALYAVPPAPEVKRRHGDAKDDVARAAALIFQRILTFDLSDEDCTDHDSLKMSVEDRLVTGLGQVWLRYDPTIEKYKTEPVIDEVTQQVLVPPQDAERIVDEKICVDFVHWNDFFWSPARIWDEVWWVARRVWLKKKKFIARFGKEKWDEFYKELQETRDREGYPKGFESGRIEIFEIWCEDTEQVYWVHKGTKKLLDSKPDPYKLKSFFPCPKPLLATHSTSSLIPRPDYVMCQDQYEELNVLNDRIYALTKALRVVGTYDSSFKELGTVLTGGELRMVPVESWAAFAEKGGLKGVTDWFPVEVIAAVLDKLMIQRQSVIQQIYEITSISDIMRGVTQARETAKAQTLKAQYSSVRLQLVQQSVAEFVQAVLQLKCELIGNLFQPETIFRRSQIEITESALFAEPAIQLIKDQGVVDFRIRVSEQSLSMADYNAEREMRIEFLTAMGQFLSQAGQIIQTTPQALPYLLRIIVWVAASFRGADDIETVLDEAVKLATSQPPATPGGDQKPPEPSPQEVESAKAQAQVMLQDKKTKDQAALNAQEFRFDVTKEFINNVLAPKQEGPDANSV